QMQHEVLANNLRWMDVELALATQDEPMDSTIIDGFNSVEDHVDQFTNEREGMPFLQTIDNKKSFESVTGKQNSEEDIREFSKDLFSIEDDIEMNINKSGDGADVPMYSVFYEDGKRVYMDITERGA